MDLKSILKSLKMNESTISMVLGAVVIIIVGLLVVNYFKGLDTGSTLPAIETENLGSIQLPAKHTVSAGEDLWKISEKYYNSGYNWVDVANENGLVAPYILEVGQVLNIPDVQSRIVAQEVTEIADPDTNSQKEVVVDDTDNLVVSEIEKLTETASEDLSVIGGSSYTVVHGDTLWNIAERAYGDGYRWVDIAKANNLLNPSVIHAGNVFSIPR